MGQGGGKGGSHLVMTYVGVCLQKFVGWQDWKLSCQGFDSFVQIMWHFALEPHAFCH